MTVKYLDVSDLQKNLKEIVNLLHNGEEFILLDESVPLAKISPIKENDIQLNANPSEDWDDYGSGEKESSNEFWFG